MITLNGQEIIPTRFPDNTCQVWHLGNINTWHSNEVWWWYENDSEIMQLHQLFILLAEESEGPSTLYIPYLPYARQDKQPSNETSFGLMALKEIMSGWGYGVVITFDKHSYAMPLPRETVVLPGLSFAKQYDYVLFPDQGALRYRNVLPLHLVCGFGEKSRESDGKIKELRINNPPGRNNKVLVVDDICDGGATFLEVGAKLLPDLKVKPDLYVSHGLFSKGVKELLRYYGRIYTTDSCLNLDLATAAQQSIRYHEIYSAVRSGDLVISAVETQMRKHENV